MVLYTLVFLAAVVRGYTGFGFSAIAVLALVQTMPVATAVPVSLLLDIVISIPLILQSRKQCCYQSLKPVLLASLAGIPLGLIMLLLFSDDALRGLVSSVILGMALLSRWQRFQILAASPWISGVMSGWTTSAVSAGGAPVILHMMQSTLSITQQRATLIILLFIISLVSCLLILSRSDQLTTISQYVYQYLPVSIAGSVTGTLLFKWFVDNRIQHAAFLIILALASLSLVQAFITYQ